MTNQIKFWLLLGAAGAFLPLETTLAQTPSTPTAEAKAGPAVTDQYTPGDPESETAHSVTGNQTFSGEANGGHWRDARNGGYFEFSMKVAADTKEALQCTYWGGDADRAFDILVDGVKLASQTLNNNRPGAFFKLSYPLPPELVAGKNRVTVRFQSTGGKTAGGLFGGQIIDFRPPAPLTVVGVHQDLDGATLTMSRGILKLQVFSDRVIRVLYRVDATPEAPSLVVIAKPVATGWKLTQTPTEIRLKTASLEVRVGRGTGAVGFYDNTGQPILREKANGKQLAGADAAGTRQDFELTPGEAIYGLGQHQNGLMDYRGHSIHLQQENRDVAVPVLLSSRGYGVLWDNAAVTDVDVGAADPTTVSWNSETANPIDYYFMSGPDLDTVIASYRDLTGPAPMFGRWAWGFWQCKERYKSQQELLDVVGEYRKRGIPLDGIIQDWQYWTPNPWGSHQFDAARYPDPAQMMDQLHAENAHLLISVWAKFDQNSPNADELRQAGGLYGQVISYVFPPGKGQWYDAFSPVARQIYWAQMSKELFAKGIDGWWLDASEPELSGHWGEFRDFQTSAGPGASVYNAYPLMHTTSVYTGQRAETSKKRVFILTRSAYAGQQRNAAVTWSGDIGGNWDTFRRRQIPAGINFCLSGIPYWNTDTGGFFGGDPADSKYQELFTRWFQFSAFCPMFRVHGTGPAKEMWRFDAPTQKILADYDRLRYHLLPYIYSTSWQVTHRGYTMMRGLALDFRSDTKVRNIGDQYLFGPSLMVCPVTAPGASARGVYLPDGTTWTDFWTGESMPGGQTVQAAAPIETEPIYVRAGSIVPFGPEVQNAEAVCDPTELRIYTGANGSFELYEDEGDDYDYEKGAYATIPLAWDDSHKTLTIGTRAGQFTGMLTHRTFRVVLVRPGHGNGVESTPAADETVAYNGQKLVVRL